MPFPFFLAYATAVLEKNNIDVDLVDAIAEGDDHDAFMSKVKRYDPDLVLIETSTPSIYVDLAIAREIKERNDSMIALSGPHVSALPEEIMKNNDFVDFVLIGEYEYTLMDLVECLEKKRELRDVKGLAHREDSRIQVNPRRPLISNLDELPWPARHFLPMYNYTNAFCDLPTPDVQMWASRGCPFRCIYCMWPRIMYGGPSYRTRDPVKVVDEMEWLIDKYKFRSVYFDDDTFNIGKKRILKLCEEIKKRKIDIPWAIMARADTSDEETLKAMRDAGLFALKYGVESGVQELADNAKKDLDLNRVRETVKITKELGIKVHLTFTFGLPGETFETVEKTMNFAKELDPDSCQFSIVTPFPGTELFDLAEKNGWLITKDWSKYDGACSAVIRTENLTPEDLEDALRKASHVWGAHSFKKQLREKKFELIKKGLRHPLKGLRELGKLIRS